MTKKKITSRKKKNICKPEKTQCENGMRKAVLEDFLANTDPSENKNLSIKYEKPKNYRLQGEYGEKKFIKP